MLWRDLIAIVAGIAALSFAAHAQQQISACLIRCLQVRCSIRVGFPSGLMDRDGMAGA